MATIRKRGNSYQIRVSCGSDIYADTPTPKGMGFLIT